MDESPPGVGEQSLPQEFGEFDFVSEEGAGDIDRFASHDDHFLTYITEYVPLRTAFAT